ncbi:hypothetical protein LTR56_019911 [Elasticomyces elasticus]|nr:hypothetical protein LTR56_019911 [Elasticomyces elasticus]KAK3643402.1 hypothetical protein LTR22_015705 [Elasticomyces elasticus]KAK4914030.1 hypothetical protein LTR49_017744 [Elasticomyces elasticus]KAK5755458.1 hypothetical protein LTS12_014443 [Elasticomyces elasticus]
MAGHISLLLIVASFCLLASPAVAFGAGEVPDSSPWDGYVWRHGDIEKVLTILPVSFISKYAFTKMQARQVYFGNWLRDYSQLLDTKLLNLVHESVLRGIVSVLGFMEFGLATGEFDVTMDRLDVYRHEHHIDNPFGYGTDLPDKDASLIDGRLRGPVKDEELEIDPSTGMKNYIANAGHGWDTAAEYIKRQLQLCIEHGRFGDQNEAFIHLGAALHTLEDFAAHSNYTELVLRELGVDSVFPFVGDECRVRVPGTDKRVPPITTGTFGALDILHSLLGEADDKAAVLNQGVVDEDLRGTTDFNVLNNKLSAGGMAFDKIFTVLKMTVGVLAALSSEGSKILSQIDAIEATAEDACNSPAKYDPSDQSTPMPDLWKTIEPAFKLHDDVKKWLLENDDLFKVPVLSEAVENISNCMNALVYKFLAVLIEPSLQEVRNAAKAASVAASEAGKQSDIFRDGSKDSNPSHSDIAKDHFSNLLNQPAGLVATVITNWTTRMVVQCWDDKDQSADDMINRILSILHHPAFTQGKNEPQTYMFHAVETWWNAHSDTQRDDLRFKLSKESAKNYYDHHDHTIQASDFLGSNKLRYPRGFDFLGSRPELLAHPDISLAGKTKELILDVSSKLNEAGQAVVDGTVEVIHVVGDAADVLVDNVGAGFDAAEREIENGAETVGQSLADAGSWVGDTAEDVVGTIGNAMPWNW